MWLRSQKYLDSDSINLNYIWSKISNIRPCVWCLEFVDFEILSYMEWRAGNTTHKDLLARIELRKYPTN